VNEEICMGFMTCVTDTIMTGGVWIHAIMVVVIVQEGEPQHGHST
jgi:hypothetical protein